MSSRSLAAARARRAGETAPPVSGNRPGTSIGSHAAFAQQMPSHMSYNTPPPPNNVRVARAIPPQQPPPRQTPPQYQQFYDQQPPQQPPQPPTPQPAFSKLSISDAIGLITIRLGRVEQWILDTEEEEVKRESNGNVVIPENHKVIDNSVLTSMVNRLDLLEKMGPSASTSDEFKQLSEEVKGLTEQFKRMSDDVTKHTLELTKNTEQVFRFNRELVETKDILKSFMIKYDVFVQETSKNFSDYEYALSDLERRLPAEEVQTNEDAAPPAEKEEEKEEEGTSLHDIDEQDIDLKSIIKRELANI
ncbi:MAG: hypothetical protein ACOVRN_01130 [Flavobacterium sp.]